MIHPENKIFFMISFLSFSHFYMPLFVGKSVPEHCPLLWPMCYFMCIHLVYLLYKECTYLCIPQNILLKFGMTQDIPYLKLAVTRMSYNLVS